MFFEHKYLKTPLPNYSRLPKGLIMIINKHNIDTCSSLPIGSDVNGNLLKIRIDKLTIVSSFIEKEEKSETYKKLKKMRKRNHSNYYITHIQNKEDMPYRTALLIKEKNHFSPLLLRIDYSPINRNTGGIRLDFYPQYLSAKKNDQLLSWLNMQLGEIFYHLLTRAWVTRIDIALDLYDRYLDNYIWELQRSGKPRYFNEGNGLPGIQLGSNRSVLHVLCYEKIDAFRNKNVSHKNKNKFLKIKRNEHKNFLRIEARYRPNSKPTSKHGSPLMLRNILEMENPFKRLQFYSNELKSELLIKKHIISIPSEPSVFALKCRVKKENSCSRIPRNVQRIINEHKISIFNKNIIWDNWPIYTKQLGGIFTIAYSYKDIDKNLC